MNNGNSIECFNGFTVPFEIWQQNETQLFAGIFENNALRFLFMLEYIVDPLKAEKREWKKLHFAM